MLAENTTTTQTQAEVKFTPERLARVQEIIKRYPEGRQKSALLPVLHLAQEQFGWMAVEVMDYVASLLSIKPIEVYEVATFYTMFHMNPVGKYVLEVCRTGPCCLRGAEQKIEYMEQKLGIKVGETTPDGMFTIKAVECLASCGTGPMLQMGDHYYENLDEQKIDQLFEKWRSEAGNIAPHYKGKSI